MMAPSLWAQNQQNQNPPAMPDGMLSPVNMGDPGVDLHAGLAKIFPVPLPQASLDQNPQHQLQGAMANGNQPEVMRLHDQGKLANDYAKDASPWGSPDNHPGFFGKLAHALSHATGGDTRRGWEEQGLAKQINTSLADESTNDYRKAETAKAQEETAEMPQEQAEKEQLQDAQITNLLHPQAKTDFEAWRQQNPTAPVEDWIKANGAPAREQQKELKEESLQQQAQMHSDTLAQQEAMRRQSMGQAAQFHAEHEQDVAESRKDREAQQALQNSKPTADEQRRSDLAENLNENLNTLEDIVKRRPELFGPLAGRWAELKQKFGSDDPDLGTLQTIEHQIGMAQISAHGMRSALGIQAAGDSIMNNLHSGPAAIMASINAARNSVNTFTKDAENPRGSREPKSAGGGAPSGPPEGADVQVKGQDGKMYWGNSKTKQVLGAVQ